MFDVMLRPVKERVLAPAALAVGQRIHPMTVTIAGFVLGIAAAVFAARGATGTALSLWLGNRILDGFDGTLARTQGRQSDFGGYLDIVVDFAVYAAIPLGLVVSAPNFLILGAALVMIASFYVNAASWMYLAAILERRAVGAISRNELTTVTMPEGLVGGTETIIFYTLFFAMPQWLLPLFAALSGLVLITIMQRLAWAARHL